MSKVTPIGVRKADHIRINLEEDVRSSLTTGLEKYRFIHEALPEIDLDQVDLSQTLFQKRVLLPDCRHQSLRNQGELRIRQYSAERFPHHRQ